MHQDTYSLSSSKPTDPSASPSASPDSHCPFTPTSLPAASIPYHPSTIPTSTNISLPPTSLCVGGGVAIFHLATSRVVLCYHSRDKFYFLPKGRRDVDEESRVGAEREGFEESGFRCRVLPLPLGHIQPRPASKRREKEERFVTEPILTQLLGLGRGRGYLLHWFVAETVPPAVEREVAREVQARLLESAESAEFVRARGWGEGLTLRQRVEMDYLDADDDGGEVEQPSTSTSNADVNAAKLKKKRIYQPVRHEGTGVDAEEALYESYLVDVEEAIRLLSGDRGAGMGMEWVVRWGWEAVRKRWEMERRWEEEDAEEKEEDEEV